MLFPHLPFSPHQRKQTKQADPEQGDCRRFGDNLHPYAVAQLFINNHNSVNEDIDPRHVLDPRAFRDKILWLDRDIKASGSCDRFYEILEPFAEHALQLGNQQSKQALI